MRCEYNDSNREPEECFLEVFVDDEKIVFDEIVIEKEKSGITHTRIQKHPKQCYSLGGMILPSQHKKGISITERKKVLNNNNIRSHKH